MIYFVIFDVMAMTSQWKRAHIVGEKWPTECGRCTSSEGVSECRAQDQQDTADVQKVSIILIR